MGRAIVAYEGRDTLDGRLIQLDALTPKSSRIPIYYEFSYTTPLGWAEEFGRRLNPETGWGELSFELNFRENWGDKVREHQLIPTIGMTAMVSRRVPYDQPEKAGQHQDVITSGDINCISFGIGLNAWGDLRP